MSKFVELRLADDAGAYYQSTFCDEIVEFYIDGRDIDQINHDEFVEYVNQLVNDEQLLDETIELIQD